MSKVTGFIILGYVSSNSNSVNTGREKHKKPVGGNLNVRDGYSGCQ